MNYQLEVAMDAARCQVGKWSRAAQVRCPRGRSGPRSASRQQAHIATAFRPDPTITTTLIGFQITTMFWECIRH